MARTSRNNAFKALFDLLLTVPPPTGMQWGERTRGLKHWDQVPQGSQPAMFLQQIPETASRRREMQIVTWEWRALVFIYFRTDTLKNDDDWRITNDFLDAFDRTIQGIPVGERQTLGGKIYDCYVEGEIGLYEAIDDPNQGVIVIPVVMLTGL